jgi:hypothetical protein
MPDNCIAMLVVLSLLAAAACGGHGNEPTDASADVTDAEGSTELGGFESSPEPEFPPPEGQVEVLWHVEAVPPDLPAGEIRFALLWTGEDIAPLQPPPATYEEGQPASLVVDLAKHFSALENSSLGTQGFAVGMLVTYRDVGRDDTLDFETDTALAIDHSHVFVYIGTKQGCFWEHNPEFAPYLNFTCIPGVYVAEVMRASQCSEEGGNCVCPGHDGAKKLNSQPPTLDVHVDLSEEFLCSEHLNFF